MSGSQADGSLARSIVWGIVVSSIVLLGGSVITMWATTGRLIDGVAVGAFCAAWGGPGFGAMFGAGAHALRNERRAALAVAATQHAPARPVDAIALGPVPESRAWTV